MWRLLLGRGLGRCCPPAARPACAAEPPDGHGPSPGPGPGPGPERAPGCKNGRPRDGRERGGRQQPLPGLVPHYSVLEAVTWGAFGALLLQLVRQISWLRSLQDSKGGHRSLWISSLPSQQTVVTEASTSSSSAQLGSHFLQKESPEVIPEHSSSGQGGSQPWAEEGELQVPESSSSGPGLPSTKGDPAGRGHLEEAAFQLQQIFRIDISIALNILGIESMRAGHYRIAYTCFKLAADRGYSKAQFNVGLCYEHGRGTEKDLEKAAFYYYHAASSCHPLAQYRYARCLLCHRPENEWHRHPKAVTFLEQAAMAGITEAQACLGVFYMRGLQPKEKTGLKYLLLAARSGDAQSRYHVGVCYEKGLGVQQNLAEAMRHYQEAAAAGNRNAAERLRVLEEEAEDVQTKHTFSSGMRSSSSSPCFWATELVPADLHTSQPRPSALSLSHSWSTDSLHVRLLGAGWSRALGSRAAPQEPHRCWW
ncbi:death ligand signal enhancer isoform X2 [Colius striatus]|uniref:death ligand signal enhancer isoform X2 n=1 Tax=Colius striatus TaxID=57412 RepID=UPI002B1D6D8F|nr:death ligand signal enhancer isoform X2 [Colius striatus]